MPMPKSVWEARTDLMAGKMELGATIHHEGRGHNEGEARLVQL